MKKQIEFQKILYTLMRVSLKQLFLAILFVGVSIAGSLPAQDLVNSRVSVSAKSVSLSKILSEIEKKVNVKFTYQSQLLPENEVYSVNYKNSSLSNALQDLLAPLGIQYQLIGRQVVLTRSAEIQASASTSLQAPIDVKVSGVVTDEKGAGSRGLVSSFAVLKRGRCPMRMEVFQLMFKTGMPF
jgi:hypothetical protein